MSNTLDFEKICSANEANLRKAEVLIYTKGTMFVSKVKGNYFPQNSNITILHNMSDNNSNPNKKVKKSRSVQFVMAHLRKLIDVNRRATNPIT